MMKKICWHKICNKKNNYPENGLTCCYCKYVTHKKCAIYKAANKFICSECQSDMFPFTNIQDHDMLDLKFNSDFQCICLENQVQISNMEEHMQKQAKPSLIDNIFINFTDLHCYGGNLLEKISDHLPNFLIAENLIVNIEQQQKPTMSDFAKFDSKKLAKEIDDLNLEEKIKTYTEINEKYDFFHKLINNNAPIREQTKEKMKRKKTKHTLLKQFLKNKDRLIYL